ncbi:hypothetical protein NCCP2222_04190 [Sporosarcina sp. NCCP-2222]|uniref:DUF488 domain-containing protein n=1 Tax=Sporosarcina sp. NCCP-2222 TaxID=2935073 RepID=UPI0020829233|nr:DUF488 domain-containing protein [Sporosarcina sp. NCCP-2222]GKV54472.1 hypothetical protein NCCP2222_04190 [Sporosarcina sp. NCCP-2222]
MEIFTIGHYSHSQEEFIELLELAEIEQLVDVRAFPGSRKFPWFKKEAMAEWLPNASIAYRHMPDLGGRRPSSDLVSPALNDGWQNASFHNYADYTLSHCFHEGIDELMKLAKSKRTAYCCSERHPARCHRLLISNWLAAHEWDVTHIIPSKDGGELVAHELGKWGAMPIIEEDGTVVYPKL